ncbi:DNA protecting protein DprA [Campylobacterota bacterium]|nr:DNA protecting protein DprA [Campylobacterota bacterium]
MIQELASIPQQLQTIAQPPKKLYFCGNADLLNRPIVAVVGSRSCGNYAKTWTRRIASALSLAGAVVVSGGAMGIDAIAHEAAFPNTIAILAGSIDVGFTQANRALIERMKERSLILSEYDEKIEPRTWSFVHRNRLVTALASAVCIMEATTNSGSMTSANFAISQRRELFALPHRIDESSGTNGLIASGAARAIWGEEQLLEALGLSARISDDELIRYCLDRPTYEEALERFGARLFEYELGGKISIANGRVEVASVHSGA